MLGLIKWKNNNTCCCSLDVPDEDWTRGKTKAPKVERLLAVTDADVVDLVVVVEAASVEQIYRMQGDRGTFSSRGQSIGASGVGQLSRS